MDPVAPTPQVNSSIPVINPPVLDIPVEVADNTSGMGKNSVAPEEIKGWSWGAFLWNWIWAIGNKTWIGLVAIIPLFVSMWAIGNKTWIGLVVVPFLTFTMAIVLGIKGREWAWKSKHWDSVEAFKRIQRNWAKWGLITIISSVIFIIIGGVVLISTAINNPIALLQKIQGGSSLVIPINPSSQSPLSQTQMSQLEETQIEAHDGMLQAITSICSLALKQYYTSNKTFPWKPTSGDLTAPYSTQDLAKETWLNSLVSIGFIRQSDIDQLKNLTQKVYVEKEQGSESPVYFCFQPVSSTYKSLATASCKSVQDVQLQSIFCAPGGEYLCTPDLNPKSDSNQ